MACQLKLKCVQNKRQEELTKYLKVAAKLLIIFILPMHFKRMIMKPLILLLLALILVPNAHALIYVDGSLGVGIGSAEMSETGTNNYKHDGFVLDADFNLRAGLSIFGLSFGPVYGYGKFNSSFTRKDTSGSIFTEAKYDTSFKQNNLGAFLGFNIPVIPLRIWGEYYFDSKLTVNYAVPKSENPFAKDDKFKGKGYGIGLAYRALPILSIFGMYKSLEYDEWTVKSTGATRSLPSTGYSTLKTTQGLAGILLSFDFL